MVPLDNNGIHFDDQLYCKQIETFQIRALYQQKWRKSLTTKLQVEASTAPNSLLLINKFTQTIKTFAWTNVFTGNGYNIYETTFNVADVTDGVYHLYLKVVAGALTWETLSEPIRIGSSFENLLYIKYKNSFNKDDVAWTTGIEMLFQCEMDIQDFDPEVEETDFVDQTHDTVNLDAVPSRMFLLNVGDTRDAKSGVPPYMIDILNRIFACDYVNIEGKQYNNKSGSKFKITRIKTYPLIGASLEIVERFNSQSLEFSDNTPLPDGFIAAYNIETGFFGPGSVLPIIEVEENG